MHNHGGKEKTKYERELTGTNDVGRHHQAKIGGYE
jgi:hypothetical protein